MPFPFLSRAFLSFLRSLEMPARLPSNLPAFFRAARASISYPHAFFQSVLTRKSEQTTRNTRTSYHVRYHALSAPIEVPARASPDSQTGLPFVSGWGAEGESAWNQRACCVWGCCCWRVSSLLPVLVVLAERLSEWGGRHGGRHAPWMDAGLSRPLLLLSSQNSKTKTTNSVYPCKLTVKQSESAISRWPIRETEIQRVRVDGPTDGTQEGSRKKIRTKRRGERKRPTKSTGETTFMWKTGQHDSILVLGSCCSWLWRRLNKMPAASQTLFPASASSGGNSASSSLSLNSLDNMDAANHAFNHHASHQGLVGVGGGHHGLSVGGGHGASRGGGAQGAQSHSHQGHAGQFAGRHHSFTLPSSSSSSSSSNPACTSSFEESRTVQLALELAMLQGQQAGLGGNPLVDSPTANLHHSHHSHGLNGGGLSGVNGGSSGLMSTHHSDNPLLHPFNSSQFPNHGSLEDLKARRSQNMTECVPVPTSEHVAEIVGRQGKPTYDLL